MSITSNGIKAGAVAGIVYGIVAAAFVIATVIAFKSDIISSLQNFMNSNPVYASHGITAQELYNDIIIVEPIIFVIGGIIIGLIFGLIFAHVSKSLPGTTMTAKAMILGIVLFLILNVALGISDLREYGAIFYGVSLIGGLVAAIIYSFVLAKLYARWSETNKVTVKAPNEL